MNIENSYKVGDKTFTNLKEAEKYVISIMYDNGLDWIIQNHLQFTELLLQYAGAAGIKHVKPIRKIPTEGKPDDPKEKGNLAGIAILLQDKYIVTRDANNWPVYHFSGKNGNKTFSIRFIGKVWELYNLINANRSNVESVLNEYKISG
jgi:hypothetical protein